jgi:hypothetical protein
LSARPQRLVVETSRICGQTDQQRLRIVAPLFHDAFSFRILRGLRRIRTCLGRWFVGVCWLRANRCAEDEHKKDS